MLFVLLLVPGALSSQVQLYQYIVFDPGFDHGLTEFDANILLEYVGFCVIILFLCKN